eukprot:TCONS_00063107-protein
MKLLLVALALVHIALCVEEDKLPTAADLLTEAKRTCADFIATRPNAVCSEYGEEANKKTVFFETFAVVEDDTTMPEGTGFDMAQAECNANGGFLATFNSNEQLAEITTMGGIPDLDDGDSAVIIIGIKDVSGQGTWQNFDMIKTAVPSDLAVDAVMDQECLAIKIAGVTATLDTDGIDTTPDTITYETIACPQDAATTHYMCRFNYISNSIIYIDEARQWSDAMVKCQEIGGDLFSMKNAEEKMALNCLLNERVKHTAWIGLNDLNHEGEFTWSDYSISKYTPFCTKPAPDALDKDCVMFQANTVKPHDHANKAGCIQDGDCSMNLPYVCKIRDPESDVHSVLFKEYLVHLLKDVVSAEGVCGRTCGNGIGSMFGHKSSGLIPRKKIRVVRKGGRKRQTKQRRSKHKILPRHKKANNVVKRPSSGSGSLATSHSLLSRLGIHT